MAVTLCTRSTLSSPVGRVPQPPRSKRADLILLRQGMDIALAYFNSGTREELPVLTARARIWSDKYYRGYKYGTHRATGLLKTFPNLFNLSVEAPLRLSPARMTPKTRHPEAEGSSLRDHRRAERKVASDVEAFPQFAEPLLVSDAELDQVIDFQPRQAPAGSKAKPVMRVDSATLRGSGLMESLPEFLGQLARANLETETRLASNPEGAGFELDDEAAAQQPHIEMDVLAGLIETQQRRHARRVILPGGRPFKLPGDETSGDSDDEASEATEGRDSSDADGEMGRDSGNGSDASTSTTASLRINLKKRKARQMSGSEDDDSEEHGVANKLRINYHHPPAFLASFDMKRRELIKRLDPEESSPDPFATLALSKTSTRQSPSSPSNSASSSSSGGPTRIIKIRVPESMRSSAQGSRAASPEPGSPAPAATSTNRRIIRLRDPRKSQSPTSSPQATSPRVIIRLKTRSSPSPTLDSNRSSPASDASSESSKQTWSIEVVRKSVEAGPEQEPRAAKKSRHPTG